MSSRSRFLATFVFLAATAGTTSALAASWQPVGGCANYMGSGWMTGCDTPDLWGQPYYWNGSSWSSPTLWAAPLLYRYFTVDLVGQPWLTDTNGHVYKGIGSPQSGYVIFPFGPSSFTADMVASGNSDAETYAMSQEHLFRYDPPTQSWVDMTSFLPAPCGSYNLISVWSEQSCTGHTAVVLDACSELHTLSGVTVRTRFGNQCEVVSGLLPPTATIREEVYDMSSDTILTKSVDNDSIRHVWKWTGSSWTFEAPGAGLYLVGNSPANGLWAVDDNRNPMVWR